MGSYAQEQVLPASVAVPVPPSVDHKEAASVMLKGMTAHVLLRRVFKVYMFICYCVVAIHDAHYAMFCMLGPS